MKYRPSVDFDQQSHGPALRERAHVAMLSHDVAEEKRCKDEVALKGPWERNVLQETASGYVWFYQDDEASGS